MAQMTVRTQSTWSLLVKLFFFCGGTMTLLTAIFHMDNLDESPLYYAFVRGGIFGALLAVILGGFQVLSSRSKGLRRPIVPVQVATVTIAESGTKALDVVRKALTRIPARETESWGRNHAVLLARVPMSWSSCGEEMRFTCHPNLDGSTEIHVSSRPLWRSPATIDMGKGLKNVTRFLSAIAVKEE